MPSHPSGDGPQPERGSTSSRPRYTARQTPADGEPASGFDGARARKLAFADFVRKALADVRATRAWTGVRVAEETGVSRQTINRWVRADWSSDPEPQRVVAFCEGLGIDPVAAFGVLGWDRTATARPHAGQPPMDPDVAALLRRLVDPHVSDAEKFHIRETVRYLAYRPVIPQTRRGRRQAG